MPKLSTFRNATRPLVIDTGDPDEPLTVRYRPRALTPRLAEQLTQDTSDESNIARTCKWLELIVAEWDLLGDDGQPIPLTEAAMQDVPLDVLKFVSDAILEDSRPNQVSSPASAAGS
jgi:hypothetical protein